MQQQKWQCRWSSCSSSRTSCSCRARVQAFITAAATPPATWLQPSWPWSGMGDTFVPLLPASLLSPAVYSPRACVAAGYTQQQADTAWASSQHQMRLLGANKHNHSSMLYPIGPKPAAVEFKAVMQGLGFAGIPGSSQVDVHVLVDVANGRGPVVKITTSSSSTDNGGQQVSYSFPVDIIADSHA
ncbi:hypothetical protein COO60DRAFT_833614 [Scenedesmus sp. NREL 46B-D3]|nr:hypothetical protein COO60DRAFT_833614 [Scenedesmus sp. NREL 46B-D3]